MIHATTSIKTCYSRCSIHVTFMVLHKKFLVLRLKRTLVNQGKISSSRLIRKARRKQAIIYLRKEMVNIDLIHAETNEDGKLTFDEFKEQPSRIMKTL